jgi:hypothetical protein
MRRGRSRRACTAVEIKEGLATVGLGVASCQLPWISARACSCDRCGASVPQTKSRFSIGDSTGSRCGPVLSESNQQIQWLAMAERSNGSCGLRNHPYLFAGPLARPFK